MQYVVVAAPWLIAQGGADGIGAVGQVDAAGLVAEAVVVDGGVDVDEVRQAGNGEQVLAGRCQGCVEVSRPGATYQVKKLRTASLLYISVAAW